MIPFPTTSTRCTALFVLLAAFVFSAAPVLAASSAGTTNSIPSHTTSVRALATAYGSSASCNGQWAGVTAVNTRLRSGAVTSAAADWSKFPLGTRFRVVETGRVYEVDDYGSAMVGKVKVDLFTPSRAAMGKWGKRNVTLEILQWGDRAKSLAILQGRSRYPHVRRMVNSLRLQVGTLANAGGKPVSGL